MIVNYSAIAKQFGTDDKTGKKYFEILADTFMGFHLEANSNSVRRQQIMSPKSYFFDTGGARKDLSFSYLKTKNNVEIDLIINRPGSKQICVEIKSTDSVAESDTRILNSFRDDLPDAEFHLWCNDPRPKLFGNTKALHWTEGLKEIGISAWDFTGGTIEL